MKFQDHNRRYTILKMLIFNKLQPLNFSQIIYMLSGSWKLTQVMYQCVDYNICKFQKKRLGNGLSVTIYFMYVLMVFLIEIISYLYI